MTLASVTRGANRPAMLILPSGHLAELRAAARAARPAECCGLLIGRAVAGRTFVTAIAAGPDGTAERFAIPASGFAAAERAARQTGRWVCGVYHSHPAGRPVPSVRDRDGAFPGLTYVILGADNAVRAWRITDERRFEEVALAITCDDDAEVSERRWV